MKEKSSIKPLIFLNAHFCLPASGALIMDRYIIPLTARGISISVVCEVVYFLCRPLLDALVVRFGNRSQVLCCTYLVICAYKSQLVGTGLLPRFVTFACRI